MPQQEFDFIVIGAGSGGLSVGLFLNEAGFKVLMIDKSDAHIGGECLNDGCVPSKALVHVAKLVHASKEAAAFGLEVQGVVDIKKVTGYIHAQQEDIREHENADFFRKSGMTVVLGVASFAGKNAVAVNDNLYKGKKIIIATGSKPRRLQVPGIEAVKYFDNTNIFTIDALPQKLLVVGAGPIGLEMAQAFSRLGSTVTVVSNSAHILEHDDVALTGILKGRLEKEGVQFIMNATVKECTSATEATIIRSDGVAETLSFDALFAGIGRVLNFSELHLDKAGVELKDGRIVVDKYLRTTNKNIMVAGDAAGSLQFSHEAELHGRLLINNFFSPLKQKLDNDHISWVTFTDPQVATFGLNEKGLQQRNIKYKKIVQAFNHDDRAIVDSYTYGKLILYISKGGFLHKEKILGGSMVAPDAGELIQELILANKEKLSINTLFNKIYPYPVAARVNQGAIIQHKQKGLTNTVKKLLHMAFKIVS